MNLVMTLHQCQALSLMQMFSSQVFFGSMASHDTKGKHTVWHRHEEQADQSQTLWQLWFWFPGGHAGPECNQQLC